MTAQLTYAAAVAISNFSFSNGVKEFSALSLGASTKH